MARTVNIHEAKTHLSRLLLEVAAGGEVVIARAGTPLARLVPLEAPVQPRSLGLYQGQTFTMSDDFDVLPDDLAEAFGASP
jgi:prevent-host-death family protein